MMMTVNIARFSTTLACACASNFAPVWMKIWPVIMLDDRQQNPGHQKATRIRPPN
ncbi:hypothetical protein [Undibacterium sp. Ji49W]|uniref:hypothetical protein n=1 Tax=Undibacterium sp. Ji49W TaxID=3413040 RepID=UPI003BF1A620